MRFEFLRQSRSFLAAGLLLAGLPAESALIPFTGRTTFESVTTDLTKTHLRRDCAARLGREFR